MLRSRTVFISLLALSMTACNGSQADSGENSQAVKDLIQKTKDNMILVEGGSFQMGDFGPIDPKANGLPYSFYDDNKVLHKANLDNFFISSRQVSYSDYDVFTKAVGKTKINTEIPNSKYRAPNVPAGVNWHQANDYCHWLAQETDKPFALPTEAQWEYAARDRGKFMPFSTNDGTLKPGVNHSTREDRKQATPANDSLSPSTIASYPPNPLGIYQMGLNGFEWVHDWYSPDYYKNSPENNPTGPENGEEKIRRGGELAGEDRDLLTVNRRHAKPDLSLENNPILSNEPSYPNTFRCVLNDNP
ncbi:formylglycine-generating enzyme family protein [Kushneria phyllosphaerae]|uniref:Serine/threonine-protein kinase pkn1 n=1 Tax=Kushneria phyllosphaerae TaxID=2100822 RepID=A0A2R8CKX7_9GAMM|nr:SUMF1/EgtB/PvdO family nonheme iron enzyme [Kushneria phyllosphaerae]SPJ33560.1 Serine/threonine-protein kinase pkn1 [Kushneria phyllosphaerae]